MYSASHHYARRLNGGGYDCGNVRENDYESGHVNDRMRRRENENGPRVMNDSVYT
ncbi:MAG: hypothetical protein K2J87_01950 [Muribaculaceae bacterium]|nr:hypothetical protein [Muribaculaceae bacterium]